MIDFKRMTRKYNMTEDELKELYDLAITSAIKLEGSNVSDEVIEKIYKDLLNNRDSGDIGLKEDMTSSSLSGLDGSPTQSPAVSYFDLDDLEKKNKKNKVRKQKAKSRIKKVKELDTMADYDELLESFSDFLRDLD